MEHLGILLGSPFDISKFEKVSNYTVKPLGGLWVAPYDLNGEYISKWHEFLENEYYRTYNVTNGYFCQLLPLQTSSEVKWKQLTKSPFKGILYMFRIYHKYTSFIQFYTIT